MVNKEHIDKFHSGEQKEIVRCIKVLNEQRAKGEQVGSELILLFEYWHRLFPKVKQSIRCGSCRKAVIKFFGILANDINSKMVEVG